MNVAAIDIGTNSVRLLITDSTGAELVREMQITKLGQGVDQTGALHPDAIERTIKVLREYRALIDGHAVERIRATATSAARDAENRQLFFDRAKEALGVVPECIPGDDEARLSFAGATAGLDAKDGPFLVVDIGGGSTEFVLGQDVPEALISVDMGCVRMSERHLLSDPPTQNELEACFADVRAGLAKVKERIDVTKAKRMIGLAGTITALAYLHKGLKRYDPSETHHMLLRRDDVARMFAQLASATVEGRRAMLAEPKRAEVIVGGAAVLLTMLQELDIEELMVSESDILDGLAATLRL